MRHRSVTGHVRERQKRCILKDFYIFVQSVILFFSMSLFHPLYIVNIVGVNIHLKEELQSCSSAVCLFGTLIRELRMAQLFFTGQIEGVLCIVLCYIMSVQRTIKFQIVKKSLRCYLQKTSGNYSIGMNKRSYTR